MKFRPVPGEHTYAVAVRDGSDLWLTLWVRRSRKGEFFVMLPAADPGWDAHVSYHLDSTRHSKSQPQVQFTASAPTLDGTFRGTEQLGTFGGHSPKAVWPFAIQPLLSKWGLESWGRATARSQLTSLSPAANLPPSHPSGSAGNVSGHRPVDCHQNLLVAGGRFQSPVRSRKRNGSHSLEELPWPSFGSTANAAAGRAATARTA